MLGCTKLSSNTDMIKLYSEKILALATEIPFTACLSKPDVSITKRSPVCGSMITIELVVRNGKIIEFSQNVKACALGQAAAAIVGDVIIGSSKSEIQLAHDQLKNMLTINGQIPDKPFEKLEVLLPAKDYKNRHASIMLSFKALLAGLEKVN